MTDNVNLTITVSEKNEKGMLQPKYTVKNKQLNACFKVKNSFRRLIFSLLNGQIGNPVGESLDTTINELSSDDLIKLLTNINNIIYEDMECLMEKHKDYKLGFTVIVDLNFDKLNNQIEYIVGVGLEKLEHVNNVTINNFTINS